MQVISRPPSHISFFPGNSHHIMFPVLVDPPSPHSMETIMVVTVMDLPEALLTAPIAVDH